MKFLPDALFYYVVLSCSRNSSKWTVGFVFQHLSWLYVNYKGWICGNETTHLCAGLTWKRRKRQFSHVHFTRNMLCRQDDTCTSCPAQEQTRSGAWVTWVDREVRTTRMAILTFKSSVYQQHWCHVSSTNSSVPDVCHDRKWGSTWLSV